MFFQKSHSEKPDSQEIDAKIERAVAERVNELHEQLDERIQRQIVEDRAFVKDTVGVAFRIAGSAVALVIIVLGALGWKNLAEIREAMVQAAREKAEAQFVSKEGKQIIDSALDRSVLNSYLTQLALLKTDKSKQLRIEDHDADRLLRIVKNTEADDVTFESAAKILITAVGEAESNLQTSRISDIDETFASFITAKGKDEKWVANNYRKRIWLLSELDTTRFARDLVKSAYRDLLDSEASQDLRLAAIRNIGTVGDRGDRQALDKLERLASTSNDLRTEAFVAIAQLESDNKVLADWISHLDKLSTPPTEEIVAALRVNEVLQGRNIGAVDKLIEFAASHSMLLTLREMQFRNGKFPEKMEVISLTDLPDLTNAKRFPRAALVQHGRWTSGVIRGLLNRAQQNDLREFRRFVTWLMPSNLFANDSNVITLLVSMSRPATITLEDGTKLDHSSWPSGVRLWPEGWKEEILNGKKVWVSSNRLRVIGPDYDETKMKILGFLSAFENADRLSFGVGE